LEKIDLERNRLLKLHPDTFKYNPNLKIIFLTSNKLTGIHQKMFSHLNLNYLNLRNNICIDREFSSKSDLALLENHLQNCANAFKFEELEKKLEKIDKKMDILVEHVNFSDRKLELLFLIFIFLIIVNIIYEMKKIRSAAKRAGRTTKS
jgi:hypothetical protein